MSRRSFAKPALNMPPDRRIDWSPKARKDLQDIWRYYARTASVEVADRMVRKISVESERIGRHPTPGRERDDEFPGLRKLFVRPYTIFFRVSLEKAEVARVLHEERDFPTLLRDEY
jgi:toxin ParE1/3/4